MLGQELSEKLIKLESANLKDFTPPNRQQIAYSWDLANLDFPLEMDGCINVDSSEFEYLGSKFNLRICRKTSKSSIGSLGCYLIPIIEEPNYFGSFDFDFDLVLKSTGKRVPGFVKQIGYHTSCFKKGIGAGHSEFFPKDDISQITLSKYQILLFIKPNESLSTFLNSPVDYSSDIYDRMVSQINNKEASNVSFEVDGYKFHALKNFLNATSFFETLLSMTKADEPDQNAPISLKEIKINPETFHQILQWLYTGDIPMIWKPCTLFELYRAADYFLMPNLCDAIVKFITATFCEHNFGQVYEFALRVGNKELEKAVFKKWKENRDKFEATDQIRKLLERNDDSNFFLNLALKMHGSKAQTQSDEALDKFMVLKMIDLK